MSYFEEQSSIYISLFICAVLSWHLLLFYKYSLMQNTLTIREGPDPTPIYDILVFANLYLRNE